MSQSHQSASFNTLTILRFYENDQHVLIYIKFLGILQIIPQTQRNILLACSDSYYKGECWQHTFQMFVGPSIRCHDFDNRCMGFLITDNDLSWWFISLFLLSITSLYKTYLKKVFIHIRQSDECQSENVPKVIMYPGYAMQKRKGIMRGRVVMFSISCKLV